MKKFMISLMVLMAVGSLGFAQTTVTNRGQVIEVQLLTDTAADVKDVDAYQDYSIYPSRIGEAGKIVRFYDYRVHGGTASSTIYLSPKVKVPNNVIVRNGYVKVMTATAPTYTATNSIGLNSAADIMALSTNISLASDAILAITPAGTAGTSVQATNELYVTMGVSTVAITNGQFMLVLDCELAP